MNADPTYTNAANQQNDGKFQGFERAMELNLSERSEKDLDQDLLRRGFFDKEIYAMTLEEKRRIAGGDKVLAERILRERNNANNGNGTGNGNNNQNQLKPALVKRGQTPSAGVTFGGESVEPFPSATFTTGQVSPRPADKSWDDAQLRQEHRGTPASQATS